MTEASMTHTPERSYWPSKNVRRIAGGLAGLIAVFMAIKAMAYTQGPEILLQDHLFRIIVFASLTVWMTLSIGISRRASVSIAVLGFASFIELFVIPTSGQQMGTLASANLGIVFAYCGLQLYWYRLVERTETPDSSAKTA